jgi:hypothetical protein
VRLAATVSVPRLLRVAPGAEAALGHLLGSTGSQVDAPLRRDHDALAVTVATGITPDVGTRIAAAGLPGVIGTTRDVDGSLVFLVVRG